MRTTSAATTTPQACTIIARNYLAFARVLASSFLRHHPGWRFTVVMIDAGADEQWPDEPFRVLHLAELGLPIDEVHRMAVIYNVTELATAVKPVVLRYLLEEGSAPVVYLDPDIEVHHPFPEVADLALERGIVLTPHVLQPMPRDGLTPSETHILISGMFNLGFIAVGPGAAPFLEFWAERLRRDALVDPCRGLFTDQRWVDFVPILFDHHIVRDPAFNVAYWNVFQRPISRCDDGYLVGGRPLRFYHFSGFDPSIPYVLSRHHGPHPRTVLSELPVLAGLCQDYAAALWAAGHLGARTVPYGLSDFPNGLHLDTRTRRLYREALEAHAISGTDPARDNPPDPFMPGGPDRLLEWLRSPATAGTGRGLVSRYLAAYWDERPDLRSAFPELDGEIGRRYVAWAAHDPALAAEVHPSLRTVVPAPEGGGAPIGQVPASPEPLVPGVTVAGYFNAELGVGQAGRLLAAGLEHTGVPFATITYGRTLSSQEHPFRPCGQGERFDVNILCVNADQIPVFVRDMGARLPRGAHTIGLWFWEVDVLPSSMHEALHHVDEIWVTSAFVRDTLERVTTKPIHLVPLPALIPSRPTYCTKSDFGLPDRFVFLCTFDFFSVAGRKNPDDVIKAFVRAFAPGEAALVLKTINGSSDSHSLDALRYAASRHPDVMIIDKYLPAESMRALTGVADCMISLHRSEGFGLTLFEAMSLAKPVIATGYSGNLSFMDEENSFLVPFDLVTVGPGHDPYPQEARWAQPRVDDAARIMRLVFDDRDLGVARGQRAQRLLGERHTLARTSAFIMERLDEIRRTRQTTSSLS